MRSRNQAARRSNVWSWPGALTSSSSARIGILIGTRTSRHTFVTRCTAWYRTSGEPPDRVSAGPPSGRALMDVPDSPELLQVVGELLLNVVDLPADGGYVFLQRVEDSPHDRLSLVIVDMETLGDPVQKLVPVELLGRILSIPRARIDEIPQRFRQRFLQVHRLSS